MTGAVEVALLRQGLYRFFAGTLSNPDEEALEMLVAAGTYLGTFGVGDYAFFGAWNRLEELMAGDLDAAILATEFVRLFASGTDGALCPPVESFYVSGVESGAVAATVAAVQRAYRELGLGLELGPESPDHVTSELRALSELCAREATGWGFEDFDTTGQMLAAQHLFLRTHLMAWFPSFRKRVQDAAGATFYGVVVDALHAMLVHEVDWTRALADRVRVAS